MNAAASMNVIDFPTKATMQVADLEMGKTLDRDAMKKLSGGYGPNGTTYKSYHYSSWQKRRVGFLILKRRATHHKHVTTKISHTFGSWKVAGFGF